MICAAPWPERAWMEMLPISLYVGTALLKVPSPSIPFNFPVMIAQTELLNGPWVRFSIPDDHPRSWKGPEMPETPPEPPKVTHKKAPRKHPPPTCPSETSSITDTSREATDSSSDEKQRT